MHAWMDVLDCTGMFGCMCGCNTPPESLCCLFLALVKTNGKSHVLMTA